MRRFCVQQILDTAAYNMEQCLSFQVNITKTQTLTLKRRKTKEIYYAILFLITIS